jgi:hypothetical protein
MNTWSIDSEWGWRHGDEILSGFSPIVLCALCLETGQRVSFWGRDRGLASFVRDHANDLFVSHNLIAEAKYLLHLGVEPPGRWFDTMLGHRFATNAEVVTRYGLVKALVHWGLPHSRGSEDKEVMQKRLKDLRFDPDDPDDCRQIRDYCFEDCADAALLYRYLAGKVPTLWMSHATEFCLALARMEARGIAIDMKTYGALMERREEVIEVVTGDVNATHRVFVNGTLLKDQFFRWCIAAGISWPTKVSPRTGLRYLPLDDDAFKTMQERHWFIRDVRQANKTVKQLSKRKLAVDEATGRHYFGNIPFAQATGRTSFTGFLLGGPKWLRFLVTPSAGHTLLSLDFTAEEILLAAILSRDEVMRDGYASGDPHMAFAIAAGAAPPGATKATHDAVRALYKTVNLAVNYGQTEYGIAERTGLPLQVARDLLDQHRRTFATYTAWTERYTLKAFRLGRCQTAAAWPRKVSRWDNPRSVANFPIQGTGSDLMRLAVVYLTRHGLRLLATNHDGFLIECPHDQLPGARVAIDAALKQAVKQLLPGAPMRWTVDPFRDRYRQPEKEAIRLWNRVNEVLKSRAKRPRRTVPIGVSAG